MAKLDSHVWQYIKVEISILKQLKKNGREWKPKMIEINQWLMAYRHEIVQDDKFGFKVREF